MDRANTSDLQELAENSAIYSPGDATKNKLIVVKHGFIEMVIIQTILKKMQ